MLKLGSWFLLIVMAAWQVASDAPLTEDGLRAWLVSGGVPESNRRLIHEQFAQQRKQLPPWWPQDVADQEEEAMTGVDMVPVAVPFYQPCLTDPEVRLLAKFAQTDAGKRITKSAVSTHESAAASGSSATSAQQEGEEAAAKTSQTVTAAERQAAAAELTPKERALGASRFTPQRMVVLKQCTDKAYAETVAAMGTLQKQAVQAVVEKNRPALVAAKTAWVRDHPQQ
jgi:hypothetical protein